MKFISWNVNGLKSIFDKYHDEFETITRDMDFVCLQETKIQSGDILQTTKGFRYIYTSCSTIKKGYSGVAILTNHKPIKVMYGFDDKDSIYEQEGRIITLEYDKFYLLTCYTPNSKRKLERLNERINDWEPKFSDYISDLQKTKNVIICGDLNVAPEDIDIHNPKTNQKSAGFTKEERERFRHLIESNNLIDSFRKLHPTERKYSYWSNFANAREKNKGWRLDHFLVSKDIEKKIKSADIWTDIKGSDHAPIYLEIKGHMSKE